MKKIITAILTFFILVACSANKVLDEQENVSNSNNGIEVEDYVEDINFDDLDDENLLRYYKDSIYENIVSELNDDGYLVENIETIYISKEYLEELEYNSSENVFFGYTLSEIEKQFDGSKYIFTLGDDGTTIVQKMTDDADIYQKMVKNVVIGSGVILLCVTVSAITAGAGAPAVSAILAVSAKTGTTVALTSGTTSAFITTAISHYVDGKDIGESIKEGLYAGSEQFKWGAIVGAVSGGIGEAVTLSKGTANGLTMNDVAIMQKDGMPLDVIRELQSMDQYEIIKNAGIKSKIVNGKIALVRDIDLTYVSDVDEFGMTNLERMQQGLAALDPETGLAYELHHIGQNQDSTLAILTEAEHRSKGNYNIWHTLEGASEIDRDVFATQREAFWKSMAKILANGGV